MQNSRARLPGNAADFIRFKASEEQLRWRHSEQLSRERHYSIDSVSIR